MEGAGGGEKRTEERKKGNENTGKELFFRELKTLRV